MILFFSFQNLKYVTLLSSDIIVSEHKPAVIHFFVLLYITCLFLWLLYFYLFFICIEVYLVYNIVLVSGVQQNDSGTYIFRLFSIIGYHKALNIVPCAIQ